MSSGTSGVTSDSGSALLVDANLLVLWAVGRVNRNRIETFKRTRQYTAQDYDLLVRVLGNVRTIYTVAHVLAEVSNLTDLPGPERRLSRQVLKQTISVMNEVTMPSSLAAEERMYEDLGLGDAAVAAVARSCGCAVLTDDLDLYLALSRDGMDVVNFTHLRAREFGL